MSQTDDQIALLDKASAIAGSDYKVAQALGVPRQTVSNWRHGVKPIPIEDQALLAAIANIDPVAELARAAVRKHQGTRKGDLLLKALGKASPAIGAAIASVGGLVLVISGLITPTPTQAAERAGNTMCRKRNRYTQSWLCQAVFA